MGAHGRSPQPPGLEARERLEAFQTAQTDVECAQGLLAAALAAHAATATPAFGAGVELARKRLLQAEARVEAALARLADGRPEYEAFWRLPDDL